ncbi:MAG: hypothetical protein JJ931_16500, partial [Henriciella sp.]|nr:hypothetical protein [Henriciella sp.]
PIANPSYRISSGLGVRAEISVPPALAIVLPRTAVVGDSATAGVFVIEDGKIWRRNVTFESIDLDRVLIRSGLSDGEQVVLDPPATLRDGETVAVESGTLRD